MANFATKHSIMTQEMVDSFCNSFYIPAEVHLTASGRGKTISEFPAGKVGVYTRIFDVCGYRIPFTKFFMAVLKYFRVHISQLSPFGEARQAVKLLESHKAPFRRYPECFLCPVGLSPYYPFDENSYPDFEYPDGTEMGLFDFIKTADPRKVQAVEVQKGADQVKLLESTEHCFMPLVPRAPGGSSSAAGAEVSAPVEERLEDVIADDAYLELVDPGEDTVVARRGEEVVTEQPKKIKKKRLIKQSDVLLAKKLRTDHPSLAFGTGASLQIRTIVGSSSTLSVLVDTVASTITSTKAKLAMDVNPDLAGPSQLEESEGSDDSFYELATFDPSEAKRWYVPRWNITNDSLLDDGFSCRTLFNVGAARQICLGSEVRSRAEHELELKEKLNAKYAARGKLLEEKDSEILRLKSQLAEKEAEAAEVIRLRDQVSSLSGEKSTLTAEVSALKVTITQKDNDISLLDSRATHLASSLDDAKVACAEAGTKITSLASERDRLASEVSSLRAGFQDFKEKMEVQQEEQAQELYNRVAELEAHVMDVSGRLEGEFYPTYLTLLAGRRWLLTHGIQLALLKCLKSSEYQGILGHALVDAYNPEDAGMDEVLDCFLLDGPLAELLKAASLQPCIEKLSIPIHHAGDKTVVGETSLSFALMNVHARAEGVERIFKKKAKNDQTKHGMEKTKSNRSK
ncbi:hypothetical protein Tco_1222221, partial [Tanacetum coccineum]